MTKQTVFINKSIGDNFYSCENLAKICTNFTFFCCFKLAIAFLTYLLHFLTKIKQRSINMFSPVNTSSAYGAYGACYSPSPLQAQVDQMQKQMDQMLQQINWQIREQIQEAWGYIRPEIQQILEISELYGVQQGAQAVGERLNQQLGPILEEGVQPLKEGMQEIYRQSPKTAEQLVMKLARKIAQAIVDEQARQIDQRVQVSISERTQAMWQASTQQDIAQRICELLGLPQRS
jgi:hypothetical protein